jgi:hypothetical protein
MRSGQCSKKGYGCEKENLLKEGDCGIDRMGYGNEQYML